MAKKKRHKDKPQRQPQFLGAISKINEFFECDLREYNWQEVIRTKADEIWSPSLAEDLRSYLETHRDKLDFEWAKLYLLFCKETLVKEDARRVLQLADQLSKYPPCYTVKLDVAEIYKTVEGKMRRAKKIYEDLTELDPCLPHGHHYLGLVLSSLGIYERAAEEFRRAIEACGEGEPEIKARAHYMKLRLRDIRFGRSWKDTGFV
jgi:tetratricopeptide (TPR) repeat protein